MSPVLGDTKSVSPPQVLGSSSRPPPLFRTGIWNFFPSFPQPPSTRKKRLDRALVSTAYLEVTENPPCVVFLGIKNPPKCPKSGPVSLQDSGGYRRLDFLTPAGHQRP